MVLKANNGGVKHGPPYPLDETYSGYYNMYRKQGLSEKEADEKARSYARSVKIAGICAAGVLGVGACYALVKYENMNSDSIIPAGTQINRMIPEGHDNLKDIFYASYKKIDNVKCQALMGTQRLKRDTLMKMEMTKDVKICGRKNAESIYKKLYSENPEFRDAIIKHFGKGANYDIFNKGFTSRDKSIEMFINELTKSGYGGLVDINDIKFSGFNSLRPVIFLGQQNNVSIKEIKKLSAGDLVKARGANAAIALGQDAVEAAFPHSVPVLLGVGAATALNISNSDKSKTKSKKKEGK